MPEVSRGALRDLPADVGRRPTNERRVTIETLTETANRARETSGTQGRLILGGAYFCTGLLLKGILRFKMVGLDNKNNLKR